MEIRTLTVDVYRFPLGDCTNNGISGRFQTLQLACPEGNNTFDSSVSVPLNFCMVERRKICGGQTYMDIVPAAVDASGNVVKRPGWWMNGGNIASTSDSRFHEMTGINYPLCIHDRKE